VTTIEYELLNNDRVHLNVYNALGQRVALLENGAQTTGVHRVEFNANSLPSGTYYYELRIGSKSIVRKMTLLK
ncbi:MAG TPA: T9SS type A sorting domain-containing protein, partial [Caldithrix abyssi]|nr:T9SS type A sorting domain-containing protein [Caldithrix abyssi]